MVTISANQGDIMKKIALLLIMLSSLFAVSISSAAAEGYKLRPGDDVQISVWGEDTLKQEVKVLPDGSITYPLAGKVQVASQKNSKLLSPIPKFPLSSPKSKVTGYLFSVK
jgi:polysaccharide export outer membrane protein